jgi:hypothetical protein
MERCMTDFTRCAPVVFTILLLGCGGSAKYAAATSYDVAPDAEAAPSPPSGGEGGGEVLFREAPMEEEMDADMDYSESSGELAPQSPEPLPAPQQVAGQKPGAIQDGKSQTTPMVMYSGYLKLRVKRLLEAMDQITELTEERGGYVGSMTQRVIIVRIPKGDFEEAFAAFQAVGELLNRRVESLDVTEQFTDLKGRLAVAREARERLLKLLEVVKDVTQRLRIMQEIKRLTEQIETIESQLETIRNLVDYYTITIELIPVLENTGAQTQYSPFPWIRHLEAHATTIYDGKDEISLSLPKKFVLFEDDDTYRAQAADTTIIRGGRVENEPRGDNTFWSAAVHHEMTGRREIQVESGTAGKLSYRLYRSDDVTPRYYLVAVHAAGEDLYVIEVFYPTEASKAEHHQSVVKALETFEVK